VRRCDEDSVSADAVHEDTCACLNIVNVDVAVFGDQIEDVVFGGGLHGDGEVVLGLGWERDVDCFLDEGRVAGVGLADFDHVEFATLGCANGETENCGRLLVSCC